jgi:hypothetical protein
MHVFSKLDVQYTFDIRFQQRYITRRYTDTQKSMHFQTWIFVPKKSIFNVLFRSTCTLSFFLLTI